MWVCLWVRSGQAAMERLKVFEGVPHPYDKVKKVVIPQALRVLRLRPGRKYCRLGDLSEQVTASPLLPHDRPSASPSTARSTSDASFPHRLSHCRPVPAVVHRPPPLLLLPPACTCSDSRDFTASGRGGAAHSTRERERDGAEADSD